MLTYQGIRLDSGTCEVWLVTEQGTHGLLPDYADACNHSPNGFEWGYSGSGPAQLALALVAHATGDFPLAITIHQQFKRSIVCKLSHKGWQLTKGEVLTVVKSICETFWREQAELSRDMSEDDV